MQLLQTILLAAVLSFGTLILPTQAWAADTERPNIILIVADDLGFSDIASYGGEIRTPNIDRLAGEGLRFTNFYVAASCSPTRSMLLTGLDNHVIGLGNMHEKTAPNQINREGYEGLLRRGIPTVADVLRDHGYHTYMAGKWHLGHEPDLIPHARGFERSFSLLNGTGSHFKMTGGNADNKLSEFVEDDNYLKRLPKNYYSSRTFTDKIISYIEENQGDGKPFFAHLAFQTPHDPLQVPDDWLRAYQGEYDKGWDAVREERLARMKTLGIVPPHTKNSPRMWYVPEWDSLTGIAQVTNARRMEVYAAVVEYMDQEVGRLINFLESRNLLENTKIIFFSDNGPNPNDPIQQAKRGAGVIMNANFFATDYRTAFESWGRKDGFVAQAAPWAQVSATPFTGFKLMSFEGGLRSPLIVWEQGHAAAGRINDSAIVHVSDLAPTLLEMAGADPDALVPADPGDMQIGVSQRELLEGATDISARTAFGTEMFGGRAYRDGDWKITWMHEPFGTDDWQLFNLQADPSELNDLSASKPEIRARLIASFEAYAAGNNLIVPDRTVFDGLEDNLPPRPPVDDSEWPRGQEPNWSISEDEDDDS